MRKMRLTSLHRDSIRDARCGSLVHAEPVVMVRRRANPFAEQKKRLPGLMDHIACSDDAEVVSSAWRVALAIGSSKHPMEVGQEQRSSRSYWAQDLGDIMLLREQFPCHLHWRHGALPNGGREAGCRGDPPVQPPPWAASSDLCRFGHAALSPLLGEREL